VLRLRGARELALASSYILLLGTTVVALVARHQTGTFSLRIPSGYFVSQIFCRSRVNRQEKIP
jgi:hypothetical protein